MRTLMKKSLRLIVWLPISVLTLSGQGPLRDQPSGGEWDFRPERIWEVDKAGDDDFGRIAELLISDKDDVYLRDFAHNVSYIFNGSGRFLRKFAPQGDGDGELSRYLNRFQAGDKIVLAAPDKLHFFKRDGAFDHAVENNLFLRFPLCFIDENDFVYSPTLPGSPVHQKKLSVFDLSSGEERPLLDFSEAEIPGQSAPPGPMVMIFSLTPQVRLDHDGKTLAFGRSDQYRIYLADPAGKILSSFGLDRKRMVASAEDKRKHCADSGIPKDMAEKIIAQLPDEMTYFSHIRMIRGLIYVFAVTTMEQKTTSQRIDVFTEKGEYIHSGKLEFGDRFKFGSPSNLIIKDEYVYVILVNDQGRQTLAKYRIKLPRS